MARGRTGELSDMGVVDMGQTWMMACGRQHGRRHGAGGTGGGMGMRGGGMGGSMA